MVDYLSDEYGWSRSVLNLSGKLKRGSLRYGEAVELADALGVRYCVAKAAIRLFRVVPNMIKSYNK